MYKRFLLASLLILLTFTLVGCSDDPIECDAGFNLEGDELVRSKFININYQFHSFLPND